MKLSELKERVFRLTNNTFYDTSHMRDLINSALTILSNEAKLEGQQTYTLTPGVAEYTLPTGYKSARALVEGTIDNPVQIYNLITIEELKFGFAVWNGKIVLKPTPTDEKTLNLYFYKYATQLVEDEEETDAAFEGYGDVVASYAAAMILSLPGADHNRYLIDRYFAIWDEGRARFKADRAKQNRQASVRLVSQW